MTTDKSRGDEPRKANAQPGDRNAAHLRDGGRRAFWQHCALGRSAGMLREECRPVPSRTHDDDDDDDDKG